MHLKGGGDAMSSTPLEATGTTDGGTTIELAGDIDGARPRGARRRLHRGRGDDPCCSTSPASATSTRPASP